MGIKQDYPLSQQEFDQIYHKVPRLTVEIIVKSEAGVILTMRTIEPSAGKWHLPGGTVRYGEMLIDSVKRVAKKELGIEVVSAKQIGFIEYPEHVESGYGDPRGIAFLVNSYTGNVVIDEEADEYGWFKTVPELIHPHQGEFLLENSLVES